MREMITESLKQRFKAYDEIALAVDESALGQQLDIPKNKSLAEHLWCIIGARESYSKALAAGEWCGFSCSLADFSPASFVEKLQASAQQVLITIDQIEHWSTEQEQLLLTLSEHEVMHEGQIIRLFYGLDREIPPSVKWA